MFYATLVVYLVVLFAGLALAGDAVHLDSLVKQCKFTVDGNEFNLCPLFQEKTSYVVGFTKATPPTITSSWYRISFDGPLAYNDSKPADFQVRA